MPIATSSTGAVEDSAGVRLVTHAIAASTAEPPRELELAEEAEWQLGRISFRDDGELYRLEYATFLSDGRLAVGHGSASELLLLDREGAVDRVIGSRGSGPGELRNVAGPFASPDAQLYVYDISNRRVTVFDTAGGYVGERRVAGTMSGDSTFTPTRFAGVGAQGDALFVLTAESPPSEGVSTSAAQLAWLDAAGAFRRFGPLHRTPPTLVGAADASGARALGQSPMDPQLLAATCGDDVLVADSHAFTIDRQSADGQTRWSLRTDLRTRPATNEDFAVAMSLPFNPDGSLNPDMQEMVSRVRALSPNATVPVLSELLCDEDQNVWATLAPTATDSTRRTLIFSRDGALRGSIRLPHDWHLLAARQQRIAIATITEDGAEIVSLWRLQAR